MAESCDVTVLTAAAIRPDYRPGGESFRHIVISAGKVAALTRTAADAARAAGPGAAWVDLGPACVGPGFIDTHIHTLQAAADIRLPGLRAAWTLSDVLAAVREAGRRRAAGTWTVSARNWHESQLAEGRLPTRAELDALGLPGPVLLRRGSHLAVPDSRAAALLAGQAGPEAARALAEGAPVTDDALIARALALAGEPTAADRADDLAAVLGRLAARGLTSIREAGVDGAELALFGALRDQGRLPMRCDLLWRVTEGSDAAAAAEQIGRMPPGAPAGDPGLRLTGVKVFVDGRIADAAIDGAAPGAFRLAPPDLFEIVAAALRRRAGVGCHAVGDRAVRVVLDAYERALAAGLARDPRQLVIEHALDCVPETIRRLAASGVSVSAHPGIVHEFAADVRRHWGEQRAARAAPVRDMVAAGVRVAAGSDGDVPPSDPLRVIWFMVTRRGRTGGPIGAGQAVPRDVALDLYTRRAAGLLGTGTRRGVLRPGMDADLAAFSADPLCCPVGELADIEVRLTLRGGAAVHDPGRLMREVGDG